MLTCRGGRAAFAHMGKEECVCNLSDLPGHLLALLYPIRAVNRYVQELRSQKGVISQKQ